MKSLSKTDLLFVSIILAEFVFSFVPNGNCAFHAASQKIISPSAQYTLFRLRVTYPYEVEVAADFIIRIQLWQGGNTSVYVSVIQVWMSEKPTENLITDQKLLNRKNTEILVIDKNVTVNVLKSKPLFIGVGYSVQDLDLGGIRTTGNNHLASVHIYPQTYDKLEKQASDLHSQLLGFMFISVYLIVTLGIVVPIIQKKKKCGPKSKNVQETSINYPEKNAMSNAHGIAVCAQKPPNSLS